MSDDRTVAELIAEARRWFGNLPSLDRIQAAHDREVKALQERIDELMECDDGTGELL